ncbi:endonuclease/exonuclease/phosphatase family protein [Actinomadura sp. 9N407]
MVVITYNLRGGNTEDDRARELRDLCAISKRFPHIVALQECKEWDRDHRRQLRAAESVLGMRGILLESNTDGCHLALFVDDWAVNVIDGRHRTHLFHHGVLCVRTLICKRVIDLAVVHMAPSSPRLREIEAETFRLFIGAGHDVIAMGDWNAVPTVEAGLEPPAGVPAAHARRKLDTAAALALDEAGSWTSEPIWVTGHPRSATPATTSSPFAVTGF